MSQAAASSSGVHAAAAEPIAAALAGASASVGATAPTVDVDPERRTTRLTHRIPKDRQVDFAWKDLTVRAPSGKTLLHGISGHADVGKLVGILGPSGSGKTVTLHALAGRLHGLAIDPKSSIMINGRPKDASFGDVAAYVQQEPALMGVLTVEETMLFGARLGGLQGDAAQEVVDHTLAELGMTACSKVLVGDVFHKGISGGQSKRLSVGVELLKSPSLLLLDEPTSGLDSAAAYSVVKVLQRLAAAGRTIVCTIHQPSAEVLNLFDDVMFLSRGQQVYYGPPGQPLYDYFASVNCPVPDHTNPADHVLNLINTDFQEFAVDDIGVLFDAFKTRQLPNLVGMVNRMDRGHATFTSPTSRAKSSTRTPAPASGSMELEQGGNGQKRAYAAGFFMQFWVLLQRQALNVMRNPGVIWIRLAMYVMLSGMIAWVFAAQGTDYDTIDDRIAVLFFIAAFMVFMSIAALPFFIDQRAVFQREVANGHYSVVPYVLANFFTLVPGLFLIGFLSSIVMYWAVDFNTDDPWRFWVFALDLSLSLVVAEGIVLTMASLTGVAIIGMALTAAIYGAWMIVEGFFRQRDDLRIPFKWLYYVAAPHTYSFRTFVYTEFEGRHFGLSDELSWFNTHANFFNDPSTTGNSTEFFEWMNQQPSALLPEGMVSPATYGPFPNTPGEFVLKALNVEDVEPWRDIAVLACWAVGFQAVFAFVLWWFYVPSHK